MSERPSLLDRLGERAFVREPPGLPAPWLARAVQRWAGALIRLMWRPRMDGWDNLPDGPFLMVANHSGGGVAEGAALLERWLDHNGVVRPLAGMSHSAAMAMPIVGRLLSDLGLIPSTRKAALATLARGIPVLVCPGGDHETWRPIWQANTVDLAGRQGFLRLARVAGVPIVPLAFRGSHYTLPVLWRSTWLLPRLAIWPHLVRVRALPVSLMAVILGVLTAGALYSLWGPWAILAGAAWCVVPLTWSLPWVPWPIRARIGAPLAIDELVPSETPEAYANGYAAVVSALQALVDELGQRPPNGGREPRSVQGR